MIPAIYRLVFIAACYAMPEWKKIEDISTLKPLTYVKDAVKLIETREKQLELVNYSMIDSFPDDIQEKLSNSYMIPNIEKVDNFAIINRSEVSSFMIIEDGMKNLSIANKLIRELPSVLVFNNSMIVLNTDHDMPSRYINSTIDIIRR